MISSGDISLNLKTWYVSWSKSNWASLMGGRPFRLALADELIWFMILSVSHWVSLSKLLPLRQPVLDGQPLQINGALKRRLQVSGTKSLHTLLQLIFLRMEKINSDDNSSIVFWNSRVRGKVDYKQNKLQQWKWRYKCRKSRNVLPVF